MHREILSESHACVIKRIDGIENDAISNVVQVTFVMLIYFLSRNVIFLFGRMFWLREFFPP